MFEKTFAVPPVFLLWIKRLLIVLYCAESRMENMPPAESLLGTPADKKPRRPRPAYREMDNMRAQDEINSLQDKLLMDKLGPKEEERLTKLIELRRALNPERIVAMATPVSEQKEAPPTPKLSLTKDRERILKTLTEEERQEVRVERVLAPRRKALKAAEEDEAWIAARIENAYGKHPAALTMERARLGSKLGRWFKRGLHKLMDEPSPDEALAQDLAEWRSASARVEELRETVQELDAAGIGLPQRAGRKMHADRVRDQYDEEKNIEAIGDRQAAKQYREEHDLMATGGNLESQERGFFDDNRSLEDIADQETFREQHKQEIERARQLFTEYAGNVPHDKKGSTDHREYAAVLWNEVNGKLGRRSASAMEKAARLMGTRDVATAYMLDLAKLAETAIEETQDTREQITDLEESVRITRELTEASERVRALNRLLGWDEERNILPREKLTSQRRQIKRAA